MKKTVIITGAGSCIPYGLPSGKKLKRTILGSVMEGGHIEIEDFTSKPWENEGCVSPLQIPNNEIRRFLLSSTDNPILNEFSKTFADSGQTSIDAFLKHHPNFAKVGKLAIVLNILLFEHYSKKRVIDTRNDHWLEYLWSQINDSTQNVLESNLAFVTFNYDRVIEYYFETVISNSFKLEKQEVRKLFESIPIIHLYGKIANLPIHHIINNQPTIPFGKYDVNLFNEFKKDILNIVYDEAKENKNFNEAFELLHNAERILIMGFGYHDLNMERLKLHNTKAGKAKKVFGSCLGFNENEQKRLKTKYPFLQLSELSNTEFLRNVLISEDIKSKIISSNVLSSKPTRVR